MQAANIANTHVVLVKTYSPQRETTYPSIINHHHNLQIESNFKGWEIFLMFVPCFAGFIGLLAKALTISCRRKLISRHRNGNVPFTVACLLAPASPRQNPKSNHTTGKHCGDRTRSRMLYEICLFVFSKSHATGCTKSGHKYLILIRICRAFRKWTTWSPNFFWTDAPLECSPKCLKCFMGRCCLHL